MPKSHSEKEKLPKPKTLPALMRELHIPAAKARIVSDIVKAAVEEMGFQSLQKPVKGKPGVFQAEGVTAGGGAHVFAWGSLMKKRTPRQMEGDLRKKLTGAGVTDGNALNALIKWAEADSVNHRHMPLW